VDLSRPAVAGDLARLLEEAVAPGAVLAGEGAARHAVDGVRPRFVAAPLTVDAVGRVLALASAHGLAVVPTGNGTRLGWGAAPRRLDIVLSLARLDRILAHEPADLTLSVECGATIGALDAVLRPYRQFVPIDAPGSRTSTIGGLIATGAAGPYRARYGTMRDLLVGVTVVRADGTLVRGGGRVVKNVTGYDIPKLHVGALGTLGVVVEAHLRLHPRPAEERTWVAGFPSAEAALEAALEIRGTTVVLSRCQLFTPAALRALGEPAPPAGALALTVGSVPAAVQAQGREIAEVCGRVGGALVEVPEADVWWRRAVEVTWPDREAPSLALRIGTRPSDVVKALHAVEAVGPADGMLLGTANVATGVLHATHAPVDASRVADMVARTREALAGLDGSCVVEHAPAAAKPGLDVWGDVGRALGAMQRLKAELDPASVLNPGRYVGGI
jgi:glycolate oxidase FAD binding subunit